MINTFPHDMSGGAAPANSVRGCSGSTVEPSGSQYIIRPLKKANGPRKQEKSALSHVWDTHHTLVISRIFYTIQPSTTNGGGALLISRRPPSERASLPHTFRAVVQGPADSPPSGA